MFGPHLTVDLYGCSKEKLSSTEFVRQILDELPDHIGMHKISEPSVMWYENPETFDKGGVSGFVMIAESNISIHTFVEQQSAFVDVFSCKSFDEKKAEEYLMQKFEAQSCEKEMLTRGKHFPRNEEKTKEIVLEQRAANA